MDQRASLEASMVALARGDRTAFDAVYEAVKPLVTRFCWRALGADEGEDAAQEVVLKLFRQAADYRAGQRVEAWAVEIARWECRTRLRKRGRSREDSQFAEAASDPDVERVLMQRAAVAALQELAESDAQVILDSLLETNDATPRFRKRKQRAFERLRSVWRKRHG